MTVQMSVNKERRRDKTPAHTINVQSLTTSVGELHVVDITSVSHLSITESIHRRVKSSVRSTRIYNGPLIRPIDTGRPYRTVSHGDLDPAYTIQPVVKPVEQLVEQSAASCK